MGCDGTPSTRTQVLARQDVKLKRRRASRRASIITWHSCKLTQVPEERLIGRAHALEPLPALVPVDVGDGAVVPDTRARMRICHGCVDGVDVDFVFFGCDG